MQPRKSDTPVWLEMGLRVLVGLTAAGVYEFDRHICGFEQGLSVVTVVVPYLWWKVVD